MKKILCGILCASAGAALAAESQVTTIDVIEVNTNMANVVVAIPGLDLAGGDLAISNLVKAANLTEGDKLFAFNNGAYQAWVLNSSLKWEACVVAAQDSYGAGDISIGTSADAMRMDVGEGIWLHRQHPENSFYIYGAHVAAPTTTVTHATTALVGNPKTSNATPSIINCAAGDQILVPSIGVNRKYEYKGGNWTYQSGFSVKTGLPTITAGTGFWYVSKGTDSDVKITWQ